MTSKPDGLKSKVMPFQTFSDKGGKYIAYCTHGSHRGLVLEPSVCQKRSCDKYRKFYVSGKKTTNRMVSRKRYN